MLTVTPAFQGYLDSGILPLCYLIEMQFKTATDRWWTGIQPVDWNGQTWIGDVIVAIDDYEQDQSGNIVPHTIAFQISDPARLSNILAVDEIPYRPIILYEALFDGGTIISDPLRVYERVMRPGKQSFKTNRWVCEAIHPLESVLRRTRRTRSDPDQRRIFAPALGENDDRFFVDVVNRPGRTVGWPGGNWRQSRGT